MGNNWRKYTLTDEEFKKIEDDDPRKVLQEEFDFLAKHWQWYLLAAFICYSAVFLYIAVFLVIVGAMVNG